MLKASDIIGYKIVCIDNKRFKGEVKDTILNLNTCKLDGLIIDYGNVMHHTRILDYKNIYEIKKNKVVVKFKKNIEQRKKVDFDENYIEKSKKILGIEVVGEDENLLGFIQDIIFEEKSGNILGVVLTNGIVDDFFNGMEILPIDGSISVYNRKFIVSQNSKKNILKNIGGLKKLLESEH